MMGVCDCQPPKCTCGKLEAEILSFRASVENLPVPKLMITRTLADQIIAGIGYLPDFLVAVGMITPVAVTQATVTLNPAVTTMTTGHNVGPMHRPKGKKTAQWKRERR